MDKNFNCKTKYPLFFIHGMGFRDRRIFGYWGRIPKTLEKYGSTVFFGFQDANGSIESNCETLKKSLLDFIAETGAEKVNIIAHSKGGVEARYLISTMGLDRYIASVITLSTPHNGSVSMDKIMRIPKILLKTGSGIFDVFMKIGGDKNPHTYRCLEQLTTEFMADFNRKNPDDKNIYYRSYAFRMKNPLSDIFMAIPFTAVLILDGGSDGMLTPPEVAWGNFKGIYTGTGNRGISHPDEVDLRRMRFSRKNPADKYEISDMPDFYLQIVSELKGMGY
ncbi:MAG: alpha/beta hydrolase [Ruminococcus flavefaciens]|nr:alpha/beta hydrolase [Ruminococcus flavefaciens]MCM1229305.1 alpha/beta hydrolase [Ruminococcus flavefaciens]